MWRIMEAGRHYEAAAKLEPENPEAAELSKAGERLRNLDAFKVSSVKQLFELGECHHWEGVRLDGKTCPREGGAPDEFTKGKKKKKAKKKAGGKE